MLQNEKELIRQSRSGDREAFGLLYDHYIRTVYAFVYYKTRHKETAEDITSQTFFKALRSIKTIDPNKSFQSWIYKIAQNTIIDHFRKAKTTKDIDDVWDVSDGTDIERETHQSLEAEKVKKYLSRLSSLERDIVIMRVWQDLPYKEIADIVGKTESNAKVIYSRALQKLRALAPAALYGILPTLIILLKILKHYFS